MPADSAEVYTGLYCAIMAHITCSRAAGRPACPPMSACARARVCVCMRERAAHHDERAGGGAGEERSGERDERVRTRYDVPSAHAHVPPSHRSARSMPDPPRQIARAWLKLRGGLRTSGASVRECDQRAVCDKQEQQQYRRGRRPQRESSADGNVGEGHDVGDLRPYAR